MDYNKIREEFYKGHSEEEMQDILYKLRNEPLANTDIISDIGVNTQPILSTWVDDILYEAKRINNTMSPAQALQSDECIDKIIAYIKTKPKFYDINNEDDLNDLGKITNAIKTYFRNSQSSVVNATKVANFSPIAARKIYERYCPKFGARILDYSCGFGARMLGCLTSNYDYQYIGIEPNSKLNDRLLKFSDWICKSVNRLNNTKLYIDGSEVFHEELVDTVDLSFSSPPYFNLEIYCDEESQSANENTTLNDWKRHYMIPTIYNIYQYTKPGGLHIVNLKNISKNEPLLDMWIACCKAVGFTIVDANYLVHQSRRQFDKGKKNVNYTGDKEPIVIFKKNS